MKLRTIIMSNRAPYKSLRIDFDDSNIALLSGINGAGKTTILSYIVDSLFELAREVYTTEFEDKPNKFYRISADLFSYDSSKPSIVYLRFELNDGKKADYIDLRGVLEQRDYDELVILPDKIPFSSFEAEIKQTKFIKQWTIKKHNEVQNIFGNEILTYFPAYRYETPQYLNDPYKVKLSFNKDMHFSGNLKNPIEVISDLPQIANWIMDVVLDGIVIPQSSIKLLNQINDVLSRILISKVGERVRVGFGRRNNGASRIAVMSRDKDDVQIYPSIFNMSSGELALLCLFVELIKQADMVGKTINSVSGIVLIDEIEKHLHIQLQKDVLPKLIMMFPNIQFIASSHSPFLGLGLEEMKSLSYRIIDLDNDGITCPPQDNELFREVYNLMVNQNDQYFEKYKHLQERINSSTRPILITEGKTDWKHIKAAMKALNIEDLEIEIYEYEESTGDSQLKQLLESYSVISQPRVIIGLFDRDNIDSLKFNTLLADEFLSFGNNVYAFAIPLVNSDVYGDKISIEHYYSKPDLTKTDSNGRRIFLGEEFYPSGLSKDSRFHTKCKGIDKKALVNGIVDDRVYEVTTDPEEKHSIALSKNDFAELILCEDSFAKGFDFSNFEKIIAVIRKIIQTSMTETMEVKK